MLNTGDILDEKYEVLKILGKGGMGVVYLCKNTRLENLWAIKEIIQDTKNIDSLTEANILKNLDHAGIRRIVDVFYESNNLYMVQDYIDGQTLKEYVRVNGKIKTDKICQITSDLCDIVGYLHNQNPAILYRDIKPSNIIINSNGKVVLIDFGISKVYKNDMEHDTVCAGSNGYAAPEQYGSGKCCKQTDIYGIGMLIYFMLKGRGPCTGIEPLLDENYDEDTNYILKNIIQKCVKIDIVDRYISVEALKIEILEVFKKDKYEKIEIFSNYNTSTNVNTETIQMKVQGLKKNVKAFLVFIVIVLVSTYILYGNKKEGIDIKTADITEVVTAKVGSSSIEEENINEPAKEITQDMTKNENAPTLLPID